MNTYVMDACALIAYIAKEDGVDVLKNIVQQALDGGAAIYMHKINLLEVYYNTAKCFGEEKADWDMKIVGVMPIKIINVLNDDVFKKAGILKSKYKMSLADSVAVAECVLRDAFLVTSDHHEFEAVGREENVKIKWFR